MIPSYGARPLGSRKSLRLACLVLLTPLWSATMAWGESPAPTVHWGGIGYPDQYTTLTAGLTVNRFTEFDNEIPPTRYDSTINNTFGLNFLSLSWSKQWGRVWEPLDGLSSHLSLGIGPTADQPSKWVQNELHKSLGFSPVHENSVREDTDAMVDASVTGWQRWLNGAGQPPDAFGGVGVSAGTLYQEFYGRAGLRRLQAFPDWDTHPLVNFIGSLGVRFSGMGRYGRLADGAVLRAVKPSSTIGQVSGSLGSYRPGEQPAWEVEVACTWDSGLFVNGVGQSRKEFFGSGSITIGPVRFETWNDTFNNKDKGPTAGATLTVDLLRAFPSWNLGILR
ncbi:MAG TPA: hypothetical protein VI337_05425 [Nitrospirales bacterium]|nr:hypothetical protein [Nitrospirales bacterium]